MTTLILYHDDCMQHDPGMNHPEQPARLTSVVEALKGMVNTECLPAPKATREQIIRAHDTDYWQWVLDSEPAEGQAPLDPDTFLSPGSVDATLRASGAACFAVEQIMEGKAQNAFCATRPPGHHAETSRAMGFCLTNHIAVAAHHALSTQAVDRVAILDFDVHHGNGTQEIFYTNSNVMYVSSHQMPLYPGTGRADETGCGNIVNLPLPTGAGSRRFRAAWSGSGLPAVTEFKPDLILVSAGFDAHNDDPLAQLTLLEPDFAWITKEIGTLAATLCRGRVVSVLEGGYHLDALASSARTHVEALTGCP